MKKRILIGAVVLLSLYVLLALSNLMLDRTPDPELMARVSDPALRAAMPVLMTSCTDCHTQRARNPIYMKIPPASWLIAEHIREARSHLDMERELFRADGVVTADASEELTEVLDDGSMPPFSYKLLHWDAGLGSKERATLETWIREARSRASAAGDDEEEDLE